jgi:hypothetical protein
MRDRMLHHIPLVVVAIALSGCASTGAPSGWLPKPEDAQAQAYGAWITVQHRTGEQIAQVQGEFIAAQADSVFVLSGQAVVGIPERQIRGVRLAAYDSQCGSLTVWTIVGALSTASHGYGVLVSLPIWLVVGSIATSAQSYTPIRSVPEQSWKDLKQFARFPVGLPDGLDRSRLRAKPSDHDQF